MKFKAKITYTFLQSREAKLMGDNKLIGREIDFSFQDLLGYYADIMDKKIFIKPLFTAREIIIPWLQEGNIPDILI